MSTHDAAPFYNGGAPVTHPNRTSPSFKKRPMTMFKISQIAGNWIRATAERLIAANGESFDYSRRGASAAEVRFETTGHLPQGIALRLVNERSLKNSTP